MTTTDLCQPGRCFLKRLDQRLRRERLCEIGDASGFQRSHPGAKVVIRSYVDDRHGNSSSFEIMPQFNAGLAIQVDVENDANRFFEIVMVFKSLRGREQDTLVTELPQQSLYSPKRPEVIIDDKN